MMTKVEQVKKCRVVFVFVTSVKPRAINTESIEKKLASVIT